MRRCGGFAVSRRWLRSRVRTVVWIGGVETLLNCISHVFGDQSDEYCQIPALGSVQNGGQVLAAVGGLSWSIIVRGPQPELAAMFLSEFLKHEEDTALETEFKKERRGIIARSLVEEGSEKKNSLICQGCFDEIIG